jgi:hypothetical protein
MKFLSSFFGKKSQVDSRDSLGKGEEWATPEEWFTDTDGKKVRRKKRKCCGGHCKVQPQSDDAIPLPVMELPAFPVELPDALDDHEDTPLEPLEEKNINLPVADEIVSGLQDLADRLENNEPIPITVVQIVETKVSEGITTFDVAMTSDYIATTPPATDYSSPASSDFNGSTGSDNSGGSW